MLNNNNIVLQVDKGRRRMSLILILLVVSFIASTERTGTFLVLCCGVLSIIFLNTFYQKN